MQKWAFFRWFPNTHQTLISFVFSLWIINEFEKLLAEFGCYVPSYGKSVLLSTAVSFSRSRCSGIWRTHPLSLSTQYNLKVNTPITSVILLTGKRNPIPRTWEAEIPVNSVFSSSEMDSWCQIIQRGPYLKSTNLRNANRLDISWKATCKVIVDNRKTNYVKTSQTRYIRSTSQYHYIVDWLNWIYGVINLLSLYLFRKAGY